MSPTRIAAIRHGETLWNAEARLQGHRDSPLSDRGRAQAALLACALRDEGLTAVVSSDLGRAADTARALSAALALPLVLDSALRERGFGEMEGHTYREIELRWPEHASQWRARIPEFSPPGGESLLAFRSRCLAAVDRLGRAYAGAAIALVTHGGVLDVLYRAAVGIDLGAPRTWKLGHAAINRLLHTGEGVTLVGWNDAHHLDADGLGEAG